ncbi:unnamed protein product, partial [marine sediment metagenome]
MLKKTVLISLMIIFYSLNSYGQKLNRKIFYSLKKNEKLNDSHSIYYLTPKHQSAEIIRNNKVYVLIDQNEYGPFDKIRMSIYFDKLDNNWCFTADRNDGLYFILNGREYGPYKETSIPYGWEIFSPTGKSWAICVKKNDGMFYVLLSSGSEIGGFKMYPYCFSFNHDGTKWGFIGTKGNEDYIFFNDNKKLGPFLQLASFDYKKDDDTWIVNALTKHGWYIIPSDDEKIGPFYRIHSITFSDNYKVWGTSGQSLKFKDTKPY